VQPFFPGKNKIAVSEVISLNLLTMIAKQNKAENKKG
jgi:hypothetical protein